MISNNDIIYKIAISKKHRKTLEVLLRQPIAKSLEWRRIEALLQAIGANVIEGAGSRVRFELNGVITTFHRPHPQKEAKPYQVRDARLFLEKAEILK